ncbi:MAG: hypothetical protein Q7U75_09185, partial [Desulfobacterales bacterium]|nr:hypothetical protein [Desulfobacterales bacterium]
RNPVTGEFERWVRLALRHLERVPLQTPYPDVVGLVRDVVRTVKRVSDVVVDATGVGSPVVDLLRRADLKCSVVAVTITSGDSESADGSGYRVPKRDLMTGLQVAFEKRWLGVCDCGEATDALLEELRATRMTVTANGTVRWGASRGHDDLVMAAALAWWRVRRVWRV